MSYSRLQRLERRVEELAAHQASRLNHPQTPAPIDAVYSSTNSTVGKSFEGSSGLSPMSPIGVNGADGEIGDVVDRGLVTLESAQLLLNRFRGSATQQFPFVVIPPGIPSNRIRKDSPFLFLAIMATMSFDNPLLQSQLAEEVRTQVFRRILFRSEKNIELLQGLLIYAAWYCYFYRRQNHQAFLISQLCVTLAHDLGIDKNKNRQFDDHGQELSSSLSNAQRRAFLGTYCISCLYVILPKRNLADRI
jgi:hypothetical protein